MAISGRNFLRVNETEDFTITRHALERLRERSGKAVAPEAAEAAFEASRQRRHQELMLLGYRPNYRGRLRDGIRTWYFSFAVEGQEMIAVVQQEETSGKMIWVTTYGSEGELT